MAVVEVVVRYPFSRTELFAWHIRPGALARMTPPGIVTLTKGVALDVGAEYDFGKQIRCHISCVKAEADEVIVVEQTKGPFKSLRHETVFMDDGEGGTKVTERVEWTGPASVASIQIRPLVRGLLEFKERQILADLDLHARLALSPKRVAITGASGLIGRQVAALLSSGGHDVIRFVRRSPKAANEVQWDPVARKLDPETLSGVAAVIHLAGESIGGRFTRTKKRRIMDSRVHGTKTIATALARLPDAPDLIQASAIGVYGPRRRVVLLSEDSKPGAGFLAEVVRSWERAAEEAVNSRQVFVRTGIVLSAGGGALAPLLPIFAAGVGGRITESGRWMSWISLDDQARAYLHAVGTPSLTGPVNTVAPLPVTSEEFAETLGRVLRRPTVIPTPGFGPVLALGREGKDQLIDTDQRVSCSMLRDSGFVFAQPDLESALRHVLRR